MTQSKNILELKQNALKRNLCKDYHDRWNNAKEIKDIIDIVTDANGADFICASAANGWGCSKDYITTLAKGYINGEYISRHKGYTSSLYCGAEGKITARTTIIIVLHSNVTIEIPENECVMVYAAESDINIINNGTARVHNYGCHISVSGQGRTKEISASTKKNSWINL